MLFPQKQQLLNKNIKFAPTCFRLCHVHACNGFFIFFLQMLLQLEVKVKSHAYKRSVPLDEDAQ